jgi:hypothetical protein
MKWRADRDFMNLLPKISCNYFGTLYSGLGRFFNVSESRIICIM